MARKTTPSFVLTLKLNTSSHDETVLQERFFCGFLMYNKLVDHTRKRIRGLRQDKRYRFLMEQYLAIKGDSPLSKKERNRIGTGLSELRMEYGLSENQFHAWIAVQQHRYEKYIDSMTAQKIATTVWRSVEAVLFRKGKTIHFKKLDNLFSLEGKNNSSGLRFKDGRVHWNGLIIQPQLRKGDTYAREALGHRIKYCRIVRKPMGITYHYYLQLVLEGIPPKKHDFLLDGRVGIDQGVSTEAIVSEKGCLLTELALERSDISKDIRRIQRKVDRSRRATNPNNYNPDGTIKDKHSRKKWNNSNHYKQDQMRLKTLRRRNTDTVKQSEIRLANEILCHHGSDIFTEKMSYAGLAAKAKDAAISEATGRYKRRKRFGSSIASHAPARFLTILDKKLSYIGKTVQLVDTWKYRASQYDHVSDTYTKVPLSTRWKTIGEYKVQRDLYSAFLLMNALTPETINWERCKATFEQFLSYHDQFITTLKSLDTYKPASFGITP